MAKRRGMKTKRVEAGQAHGDRGTTRAAAIKVEPLLADVRQEYEREMRRLHGQLVALQEWVKSTGAKICIVFEGRDTAGKDGTIEWITERVRPASSKWSRCPPDGAGEVAMYVQRDLPELPGAGKIDDLRSELGTTVPVSSG